MNPALRLPLLVIALLVALPGSLRAEPAEDAAALLIKIEELRKAKDDGGLKSEVVRIPELHNGLDDAALKGALQDALGKVLKDKKLGDARQAAVDAIGLLNDKKGAWKELKGSMPDVKVEEPSALDLAVVRAAGQVAEDGAISPLLMLSEKAKSNALAKEAVDALGGFTTASKKQKVTILETLMELGFRIKPSTGGGQGGKAVSKVAEERWAEVGRAIHRTANKLTAREVATWEEWEVLYKDNKKSLAKLLPEEHS